MTPRSPWRTSPLSTRSRPYPGVGDGFNKFSGVAPGCKWAAVKVFDRDGDASSTDFTQGLDEFVKISAAEEHQDHQHQSSVTSIRSGLPAESTSLRDKVNTVVNNGIVVVAAAGNGANDGFELYRKMADPARAAMAITVGATER